MPLAKGKELLGGVASLTVTKGSGLRAMLLCLRG